ncbi:permease component of ABC-type sugar transporter [Thermobacillus composti KWC4]|uniref:Permease component of ABC-type sugar transporter n=1 Tax=Thermobacillus composti (strain DSM 18247 / JCM 13945 / KWC4) TaxID=717605 RepID=L0EF09_THECK|nr:sugar ABC transporter permease [Thermobacillus composti]AGA58853.1 permease component of ABC-type sugar transporter [Thermobacillus composti KWC4]
MQQAASRPLMRKPKRNRTEFWMLLPSIVVLAAISIFPFFFMVYASFMDYSLDMDRPRFAGFGNWADTLTDPAFWQSWGRTLVYAGGGLLAQLVLGCAIALLLYHIPRFRNLFSTLFMLPLFVAPIVTGLLWRFLLDPTYGLYHWVLNTFGLDIQVLGDPSYAMFAVILMDVWEWTPLITIIVLAGLQTVPEEPLEAADVDGANSWQKIRYILLPMVRRMIVVALLVRSMDILRYVDTIVITTEGGPADATKTIGYYLMQVAFRFQDIGGAASVGLTMLLASILMGRFFIKVLRSEEA